MLWILLAFSFIGSIITAYWSFYNSVDISLQPEIIRGSITNSFLGLLSFLFLVSVIMVFVEGGMEYGIPAIIISVLSYRYTRMRLTTNLRLMILAMNNDPPYTSPSIPSQPRGSDIDETDSYDDPQIENKKSEVESWLTYKYMKSKGYEQKLRLVFYKKDNWYVHYYVFIHDRQLENKNVKIDRKTYTVWENYEGNWTSHFKLDK